MIGLMFAVGPKGEFGYDYGCLPWDHLREDMKAFRDTTTGSALIMGRRTRQAMGDLPNRHSIVVSRYNHAAEKFQYHSKTLEGALAIADKLKSDAWVVGGRELILESLNFVDIIRITHIDERLLVARPDSGNLNYLDMEAVNTIERSRLHVGTLAYDGYRIKTYI